LIVDGDQQLLGIFTDGDLRRLADSGQLLLDETTDSYMATNPRTLNENILVSEALHMFKDLHVDQMPVINDAGRVVGLVDIQDLLEVRF
jgi:arabinose-5-phosphate isomerase